MLKKLKKYILFFLSIFVYGCTPSSIPPSINLALKISNIENGLTFDLNNIELLIYYGLYEKENSSPNSIVKCQFKSNDVEYTFFVIDDLSEKDYSFSRNDKNEIEYHCSKNITMPSTLFTDDFGDCSIGLYFYGKDSDHLISSKGIVADLTYEKHNETLSLKNKRQNQK